MAEGLIRGFRGLAALKAVLTKGSVVTVGAFDGLHLGHQRLLTQVIADARRQNLCSVAVTFEPLPREYFSGVDAPPRLMSFREKFEGLRQLGIDYVLLIRFDDNIRNLSAENFAQQLFIDGLCARKIVVGDDFRFGAGGAGDFQLLVDIMGQTHAEVVATDSELVNGVRVSSSLIRQALDAGDFNKAEQYLGRPYQIIGKVFHGQRLGRQLGFPTANVQLRRRCTAMAGVYAVEAALQPMPVFVSGESRSQLDWIPSVANVGTRPTVSASELVTLEVHLLDFDKDIYGRRITIRFCHKVRDERRFDGLDSLKEQIGRDKQTARAFFAARD